MRTVQDGDIIFGNDFNAVRNGAFNKDYVVSGCAPTVGSGLDTDIAVGVVIIDGVFYPVVAGSETHDSEGSLDRRYDLVCARKDLDTNYGFATLEIVKGTVNKVAPDLPANYVLLAVVQIDNGSTAPDAVNDARVMFQNDVFGKLQQFHSDDFVLMEDDFLGDNLSHLWTFAASGTPGATGALQSGQRNGVYRIATAGASGEIGTLDISNFNFNASGDILLAARMKVSHTAPTLEPEIILYKDANNFARIYALTGNWLGHVRTGGTHYYSLTQAQATGTWIDLKMYYDSANTTWYFYFSSDPTHWYRIPQSFTGDVRLIVRSTSGAATATDLDVDYVKVWQPRS